jgi:hypothetical protein
MSSLMRSMSDSVGRWSESASKRVGAAATFTFVWTVVFPVWQLQNSENQLMEAGFEPPLLWVRHDRTPMDGYLVVMWGATPMFKSIRKGARHTSNDILAYIAPGVSRKLGARDGQQLETLTLTKLPGFPVRLPTHATSHLYRMALDRRVGGRSALMCTARDPLRQPPGIYWVHSTRSSGLFSCLPDWHAHNTWVLGAGCVGNGGGSGAHHGPFHPWRSGGRRHRHRWWRQFDHGQDPRHSGHGPADGQLHSVAGWRGRRGGHRYPHLVIHLYYTQIDIFMQRGVVGGPG